MPELPAVLQALAQSGAGSPAFTECLRQSLAVLDNRHLPLQQGLRHSSVALDDSLDFVLLRTEETEASLNLTVGIFYQGIVAGCSCTDDPAPADTVNEACEVEIRIDKKTALATIRLLD